MATLDTILNIRVEGTDSMTKLKTQIDSTTAELKKLKTEGKSAGESQDKFNAKIVTAETKLKGLRGELNKSKTDLIKNAKAAGDTSKSYNSLTKQNAALSAQARKLSDPLGKNSKEFSTLTQKINTNTQALKKMDAQMGRQQRNVGNYKQAITSVASAVGIAIIAFKTFQRVIGTFVEFEFQMAQVGAISGATAGELQMLTDTAKELGATTAFTAGEVAGLQKELAKLGFSPEEIEGMTAATLDLAYAFGNDIAETGEVVGIVLNSYSLEASEATRVTNVLATAFSKSALDLQKFNVAFPKVGAISAQLGFSLEGTTAILGSLTTAGLEASTAGTALKSVFLKLADSNSALSQKLGGNVDSIDELLPALKQLFDEGTDVEEMLGLTDKRAVTAFATMVKGADDIAILTQAMVNQEVEAKTLAETMRDTLQGSFDGMSSAADGFMITLVEALAPSIRLIVDGLGLMFSGLSQLVKVYKFLQPGIIAYAATMVAISIAQGTFVSTLVASKVGLFAYNTAVKIAKFSTDLFSKAIKMNPIGLLASGLAIGVTMLGSFGASASEAAGNMTSLSEATEREKKSLETLNDIKKTNKDLQIKEITQLRTLTKQIKNGSLSIDERAKVLKDYNKVAGTNISNLQDEKSIVDELEKSYDSAVDAIKRKMILQTTIDQVTALIEEQWEVETRINKAREESVGITDAIAKAENDRQMADIERAKAGLKSFDEIAKERSFQIQRFQEVTTPGGTIQVPIISDYDTELRKQEELFDLQYKFFQVTDRLGNARDAKERDNGEARQDLIEAETENAKIQEKINKIYGQQSKVLDKLTVTTSGTSSVTKTLKTEYQKLGNAVKDAEKELKKEITLGEQKLQSFLSNKDTEELTTKEVNDEILRIETETATKVLKATNKLIKVKKELKVVDDKLAESYQAINKVINDNISASELERKKAEEKIAKDKAQLQVLKDLEDAGANLAKQRIDLALKVAKAELDLALKTALASDLSTDAQVKNIKRLQDEIIKFQKELNELDDDGKPKGFLNSALFGTGENGEGFTGKDFIEAIGQTLTQVSDIMGAFNDLQNERLNTDLGILERAKDEEMTAFERSAEFQVLSEEEKDIRLEEIARRHNDNMLILKIDQFKKDQKLAISQALISGAQSVMGILGGEATKNVIADAIIKGILITASVAMTALQIATINAQAPPTAELGGIMNDSFFEKGGMVNGRSHAQGGEKFAVGGRVVELEGGEAVINKKSTAMFKPMLSNMNVAGGGRKFADGGMVFKTDNENNDSLILDTLINKLNNQQVLLVEADVTNSQKNVKNIESRISF